MIIKLRMEDVKETLTKPEPDYDNMNIMFRDGTFLEFNNLKSRRHYSIIYLDDDCEEVTNFKVDNYTQQTQVFDIVLNVLSGEDCFDYFGRCNPIGDNNWSTVQSIVTFR